MLFEREGDVFFSSKGNQRLTKEFLMEYGNDFILQEALPQHSYISRFNPTSVNTLRIALYRSVRDEKVHVTGGVLRIGKNGSFCDNGHAGGRFVGIDLRTGELGKYTCDQYGNRSDEWNGIDFSKNRFVIPGWEKVLTFAEYIGSRIRHCRLIALDVALDQEGNPRLIEFNVSGFGFWLFLYSGQHPLGEYTDEIIDYCVRREKNRMV